MEGNTIILTCNYTEIDENIIDETIWYFNYKQLQFENLNIDLIGKKSIIIKNLNHSKHDGDYSCELRLKSGINLFSYGLTIATQCKLKQNKI
jgi:hypothetical protein